jgi:hypothetical protein
MCMDMEEPGGSMAHEVKCDVTMDVVKQEQTASVMAHEVKCDVTMDVFKQEQTASIKAHEVKCDVARDVVSEDLNAHNNVSENLSDAPQHTKGSNRGVSEPPNVISSVSEALNAHKNVLENLSDAPQHTTVSNRGVSEAPNRHNNVSENLRDAPEHATVSTHAGKIPQIAYSDLNLEASPSASSTYKTAYRGTWGSGAHSREIFVLALKTDRFVLSGSESFLSGLDACRAVAGHTHVVPVLAWCTEMSVGEVCVVMEYVGGGSLERVLQDREMEGLRPATCDVLMAVAWQVCMCACMFVCMCA